MSIIEGTKDAAGLERMLRSFFECDKKAFCRKLTYFSRRVKFGLPLSVALHLQVGECQKEGSGSGKQGSQGKVTFGIAVRGTKKGKGAQRSKGKQNGESKADCIY